MVVQGHNLYSFHGMLGEELGLGVVHLYWFMLAKNKLQICFKFVGEGDHCCEYYPDFGRVPTEFVGGRMLPFCYPHLDVFGTFPYRNNIFEHPEAYNYSKSIYFPIKITRLKLYNLIIGYDAHVNTNR